MITVVPETLFRKQPLMGFEPVTYWLEKAAHLTAGSPVTLCPFNLPHVGLPSLSDVTLKSFLPCCF